MCRADRAMTDYRAHTEIDIGRTPRILGSGLRRGRALVVSANRSDGHKLSSLVGHLLTCRGIMVLLRYKSQPFWGEGTQQLGKLWAGNTM